MHRVLQRVSERTTKHAHIPKNQMYGNIFKNCMKIADAGKMIHRIGDAGAGYDFFETCAERIVIQKQIVRCWHADYGLTQFY